MKREEDHALAARVEEAARLCGRRGLGRFIGFLDPHERAVALATLNGLRAMRTAYAFWGGAADAERVFLGIGDGEAPDPANFPVTAVEITWRLKTSRTTLTHRDFLGTVLSLGLERRRIGDIRVGEGRCVLFAEKPLGSYIAENLVRVGGTGVISRENSAAAADAQPVFQAISDTVASPRLDCITAALVNTSRAEAARLVEAGRVALNFLECTDPVRKVHDESAVSIRGYGRFLVDSVGPVTRKGRLSLKARKYV